MTEILDGRPIARALEAGLGPRCQALSRAGARPGLAVVLLGSDPASRVYGRMIGKGCVRVGIAFRLVELEAATAPAAAAAAIRRLNGDPALHGILLKRPLPPPHAGESLLQEIDPRKDADGCHFENIGKLMVHGAGAAPVPCTPAGVRELLVRSGHSPAGRHVVILGRSATVGKPLAALLMQKDAGADATVTLCHSRTKDLARHTLRADVVIAAVGRPRFLTREMVAADAVVIDVGTNVVPDATARAGYRLIGDADYDALLGRCRAITPVPSGVGPVTVAMLLTNVVAAAERAAGGA